MPQSNKAPKVPLAERVLDAETRASQWLAAANEASEAGRVVKAERCFQKAQFWHDRATQLAGNSDRPAPRL